MGWHGIMGHVCDLVFKTIFPPAFPTYDHFWDNSSMLMFSDVKLLEINVTFLGFSTFFPPFNTHTHPELIRPDVGATLQL